MNNTFKTIDDLYKRLKPALYSKVVELKRMGLDYIKEEDIFNYLLETSWSKKDNLSISELTNEILYLDKNLITNYVMKILKNAERNIDEEDNNLL